MTNLAHPMASSQSNLAASDTNRVLLEANDLSVRFGGLLAVNKVSFTIKQGEIFTLIGPNGAGKTTVFNLISRIYTPTSGTINFDGQNLEGVAPPMTK